MSAQTRLGVATTLFATLALLLGTFSAGLPAVAAANGTAQEPLVQTDVPGRIAGSWIVTLRPGVDVASVAERLADAHGGEVGFIYTAVLNGFSFHGSDDAAAALARNPTVRTVVADRSVAIVDDSVPTGIRRIDADDVNTTATGAGARVAILDTGIDLDHEDLQGNIHLASGKNCIDPDLPPNDGHSHGTHVAGTVAAIDNGIGVIGVAPAATLIAVKVLDDNGSGSWESVICGIDHVTALNADPATAIDVANMSLGGSGSATGCLDGALHQAICESVASGTVYAVAAGNDSENASGFVPAAYPEVLTVSAFSDTNGDETDAGCSGFAIFITCDEDFAPFSNFGSIVDVIAPGVNINSTVLNNGYGTKSGTSMAAPHAAGVAALVRSLDQSLSVAQVEAILRGTGQCPDNAQNNGDATCDGQGTWNGDPDGIAEPMVNAEWAVAAAGGGGGGGGTTNEPPAAEANGPYTGIEDAAITFTATGSSDPDGDALTYTWDFGDGSLPFSTTSETATHTYLWGGSFTVTLTVNDGKGGTASDTAAATVDEFNDAPVADPGGPYSGTVGNAITFDASGSSDFDNEDGTAANDQALTYTWNFGDGSPTVSTNDETVTHTYAATGTYTVTLAVSDGIASDTAQTTAAVSETGTTMHVGDLDGTSTSQGSSWTAIVTITVHDANHSAVADANVSGTFTYNGSAFIAACTTSMSGTCTAQLSGIHKRISSVSFTVDNIAHSTLTYDSTANHDPDGDSSGTSITVLKP